MVPHGRLRLCIFSCSAYLCFCFTDGFYYAGTEDFEVIVFFSSHHVRDKRKLVDL